MRKVTRYPSKDGDQTYGTLGTPGVNEVHVIYEGPWTEEEMDQIEARLILPYMWFQSRCYLRAVKEADFPVPGRAWYYAQYFNWRFSMVGHTFEELLQKLEAYHQQYSTRQDQEHE